MQILRLFSKFISNECEVSNSAQWDLKALLPGNQLRKIVCDKKSMESKDLPKAK